MYYCMGVVQLREAGIGSAKERQRSQVLIFLSNRDQSGNPFSNDVDGKSKRVQVR